MVISNRFPNLLTCNVFGEQRTDEAQNGACAGWVSLCPLDPEDQK